MRRFATLLLAFLSVSAHAQTYTTLQWGLDKTVSPYAFGANINGTWRNLGTVSSAGAWSLTPSSVSVGSLVVNYGNNDAPFYGKVWTYLPSWIIQPGAWNDYFHIQMDAVSVNGGTLPQRQLAEAHGMSIVMTAAANNGMAGSHAIPYIASATIPSGLPDGGSNPTNPNYQEVGAFAGNTSILSDGHYSEGIASYARDNDGTNFAKAHLVTFFSAVNKGNPDNTYPYYGYQAYSNGTQQTTFAPDAAFRVDGGWRINLDLRGNANPSAADVYFQNGHSITHDATNTYINSGVSTAFNVNGVATPGLSVYGLSNFFQAVKLASYTFATLPACNGASEGHVVYVSDGNVNTYNSAITGSGAFKVIALCNGTNWTAH